MKLTNAELEDVLNGIFDKENTTHLAIHVDEMTPGETFAKVRQKLIEIGWTPPQGE